MKISTRATLITLSCFLLAVASFATPAKAPATPKAHGQSMAGTISSLDAHAHSAVLTESNKKPVTFYWTGATKVTGGTLKAGERATVRYMTHDGKDVATAVMIEPPAKGAAAPAAATPSASKVAAKHETKETVTTVVKTTVTSPAKAAVTTSVKTQKPVVSATAKPASKPAANPAGKH